MDTKKTPKSGIRKNIRKVSIKKQVQQLSDEINKKITERWLQKLISK